MSVQRPLQYVCPGMLQLQFPFEQNCGNGQAFPHAPQFWESQVRFRQVPLQSVIPTGQTQAPPPHTLPGGQTLPQLPQFCRLVWTLVQTPPHMRLPGGQ